MVFFITVLRALSASIITNAHYEDIYPIRAIANGGLVGDVLFFMISGYCLYNDKNEFSIGNFFGWYGKRLRRLYPPVIIVTLIYTIIGRYKIDGFKTFINYYLFPTFYHFIASMVILYIPYYFISTLKALNRHLKLVILFVAIIWILLYVIAYDKSVYHIDNVYEPMVRFLFMESMLIGAWFRQNDGKYRNKPVRGLPVITLFTFVLYCFTKVLFTHRPELSGFQFVNQLTIIAFAYCFFRVLIAYDEKLTHMPCGIKRGISFIAGITLEIYVVQYVLIDIVIERHWPFPLNWIVVTFSILIMATLIHWIVYGLGKLLGLLIKNRELTK